MPTTNVIFSLVNASDTAYWGRLYISPSYELNNYSGSLVASDPVIAHLTSNSPTASVPLIPAYYKVRVTGHENGQSEYTILVPTGSNVYAGNCIVNWVPNNCNNGTASYALNAGNAVTASYALFAANGGGGGGSTQVYYGTGSFPAGQPSQTNLPALWYQDNPNGNPNMFYWSLSVNDWVQYIG